MLLISVPYRQQLNFTFEGLAAETGAVERLRTFHSALARRQRRTGENKTLAVET